MNFWRTFGIHTVSAIDSILEKDSFTLEDLLDEDEVLHECRSENQKLLELLVKPETLEKLFEYITVEPGADANSVRKYKYPFISCEILCCDLWVIVDAIYENDDLIDKLYGFLDQDGPLNPSMASHVSKVAACLMEKKIPETLAYLKQKDDIVGLFVKHLYSPAVIELLLKIISITEETLEWLDSHKLIERLVSKLGDEYGEETHESAANTLVDIIQVSQLSADSPLMKKLESEEVVTQLLDFMFKGPESALYHGLDVITELLKKNVSQSMFQDIPLEESPKCIQVLLKRLNDFGSLLKVEGPEIKNSAGTFVPVGIKRLKVAEFCVPLFATYYGGVDDFLAECDLLEVLLDMFFRYEWNNFFHHTVEGLLLSIFDGDHTKMKLCVLDKFSLAKRLIQSTAESEERFAQGGLKKGNHGFSMLIVSHILETQEDETISNFLESLEGWKEFVDGPFEEMRELAEVGRILESDGEENDDVLFAFNVNNNQEGDFEEYSSSSSEEVVEDGSSKSDDNDFAFGELPLWAGGSDDDSSSEGEKEEQDGEEEVDWEEGLEEADEAVSSPAEGEKTEEEKTEGEEELNESSRITVLERNDTPTLPLPVTGLNAADRLKALGNPYGTPPPKQKNDNDVIEKIEDLKINDETKEEAKEETKEEAKEEAKEETEETKEEAKEETKE